MNQQHESFQLAQRLLRVVETITKVSEDSVPNEQVGRLRLNQLQTLVVLRHRPGISQKELARMLQITPAAVSTMVRELESMELLVRQPDPGDARQVMLLLSEAGESLVIEGEQMRSMAVAKVLSVLPIEEQQVVVEALERAFAIARENGSA